MQTAGVGSNRIRRAIRSSKASLEASARPPKPVQCPFPANDQYTTMKYLLFIALGGASGAVTRYLLGSWAHKLWEGNLPVGTLMVNVLGSFGIGVVYVLLVEKQLIHQDWRGVLMVGFLGAFTTFSTFSLETINLMEAGHITLAVAYMLASAVLCVVMAGAAMQLTRALV